MGLDIILLKSVSYHESEPAEGTESMRHLYNVTDCSQNVQKEGFYSFKACERVYSAPYSTYNKVRSELAKLVGETDKAIWANPRPGIPFVRLINFSDCEGAFDTKSCVELAEQFKKFEDKAHTSDNGEFLYFYIKMKYAFDHAAKNKGAIVFS